MNVYQKLNACRVALQSKPMKKSGNNKFAGYSYFELGDFLPTINELFHEFGLCAYTVFGAKKASLTIVNAEKPEESITFKSPMADAMLKGCHPIQNLGAVQTYQRRYLYMVALEIVEHDALDSSEPIKPKHAAEKPNRVAVTPTAGAMDGMSEDERKFIQDLAEEVTEATKDEPLLGCKLLEEKHLDAEEKVAVWSLLDSKVRSAIKKAKSESQLVTQA